MHLRKASEFETREGQRLVWSAGGSGVEDRVNSRGSDEEMKVGNCFQRLLKGKRKRSALALPSLLFLPRSNSPRRTHSTAQTAKDTTATQSTTADSWISNQTKANQKKTISSALSHPLSPLLWTHHHRLESLPLPTFPALTSIRARAHHFSKLFPEDVSVEEERDGGARQSSQEGDGDSSSESVGEAGKGERGGEPEEGRDCGEG